MQDTSVLWMFQLMSDLGKLILTLNKEQEMETLGSGQTQPLLLAFQNVHTKNSVSVSPYSTVFISNFQQMHLYSEYSAFSVSVADSDFTSVNRNLFQLFKLI